MSRPRAATLVQRSAPCVALVNSKNVRVRRSCFCLPYKVRELGAGEYMEIQDGDVNEIEEFSVIFNGLTTREEDDDFLLGVTTEEGKEE
jgi:hypothetical protein